MRKEQDINAPKTVSAAASVARQERGISRKRANVPRVTKARRGVPGGETPTVPASSEADTEIALVLKKLGTSDRDISAEDVKTVCLLRRIGSPIRTVAAGF
jgi:hypothetical protein